MKEIFSKARLIVFGITMMALFSCKSNEKLDLLSIPFDKDLAPFLKTQENLQLKRDETSGIWSFMTKDLKGLYLAGNGLKLPYHYPDGYLIDFSSLRLLVSSKEKANYLGFSLTDVNQQETQQLLKTLKKKYPNYIDKSKTQAEAYFWDLKEKNAWLFFWEGTSIDKNEKKFWTANFLYAKRGTRIENSLDSNYNTLLDNFKMMYPDEDT